MSAEWAIHHVMDVAPGGSFADRKIGGPTPERGASEGEAAVAAFW